MPIGNFSYNPGVVSTVGETAARSNQLFGQTMMALMQGLSQNEEKAKAEVQQGKAADAWRTALGEDAPKLTGMSDTMWKALGARDKWSAFQGVNQAQATQQVMTKMAEARQQEQARVALQKALNESGPTMSTNQTLELGQGPINPPAQPGTELERFTAAMRRNPQSISAPQGANLLMELVSRGSPALNQFFKPTDPAVQDLAGLPGAKRIVTGPNSSEVRFAAPDKLPDGYVPVADARGGYRVVRDYTKITPKDRMTAMQKDAKDLQSALNNPFATNKETLQAQLDELHQQIAGLQQGSGIGSTVGAATPVVDNRDPLGLFKK